MEILPIGYFDRVKRHWRRRRYQRLDDAAKMKKKLKIARFGKKNQQDLKIKKVSKLSFRFLSPFKLLAKFHEAYVDAAKGLTGNKKIGNFAEKRVPKGQPAPLLLSALNNEMVDTRMVVEIYNRIVSSREQLE